MADAEFDNRRDLKIKTPFSDNPEVFLGSRQEEGWRKELRVAQYGGIEFLTKSTTTGVSRQSEIISIPNSSSQYVQDFGIKDRKTTVSAYFIGRDYITRRNKFEEHLDKNGGIPTDLILPTRNSIKVKVTDYSVTYSDDEGGIEKIDVSFIEVERSSVRILREDTKSKSNTNAKKVEESTTESFNENVDLKKKPGFVVKDLFDKYSEFAKTASKYTAIAQSAIEEVSKFKTDPLGYTAGIVDIFGGVAGTFSDLRGSYFAVKSFVGFAFTTGDEYSDTNNARRVQKSNSTELDLAITNIAIKTMSDIAIEIDYESRKDAVETRDDMAKQFDFAISQISTADKTEMYNDMIKLKASFIKFMNENGANLPQVKYISFGESLPSVFISNNEYGNVSHSDDIVLRNGVENSLFVPANTKIEVLVQ